MQKVEELKFLYRNQDLMRADSSELDRQEREKREAKEALAEEEREEKKPREIVFKLEGKFQALKDRVKEKKPDKD